MRPFIQELSRVADIPVSAHPNAGLPNEFGEYDETPSHMARDIGEFAEAGLVNLVGGCCGTTPAHIEAIGVHELALVAVGRAPEQEHLLARREVLAVQLDVPGEAPRQRLRRRLEAEHLLDGVGETTRIFEQRAALARAVITSPDVIIADEPTGNIDWEMSQRLLTLLVELNRMGKAVLVATHDLNLIRAAKAQVQARVLRLKDRKLQAAGADL